MFTTRTLGGSVINPSPHTRTAAAFSGVSGASQSNPSMAISRHRPQNPPRVTTSATSAATRANTSLSTSQPSR
jgi:hypothetical protein